MNASFHPRLEPAPHRFTGEDLLRMQDAGLLLEGGKFELIDGEIIDMPAEGDAHLEMKAALNRFLARALPDEIGLIPDGTLRLGERDWPEPDFYLYPSSIPPGQVRGPDTLLVIELSESSLTHDMRRKAELYRRHGVREYWVVDLASRQLHVHRLEGAWPGEGLPFSVAVAPALIPGLRVTLSDL